MFGLFKRRSEACITRWHNASSFLRHLAEETPFPILNFGQPSVSANINDCWLIFYQIIITIIKLFICLNLS